MSTDRIERLKRLAREGDEEAQEALYQEMKRRGIWWPRPPKYCGNILFCDYESLEMKLVEHYTSHLPHVPPEERKRVFLSEVFSLHAYPPPQQPQQPNSPKRYRAQTLAWLRGRKHQRNFV
jgi:hypothetical protein